MFDRARGSILKKMIKQNIAFAGFDPWLKSWAHAWAIALLHILSGSRILDVGSESQP